MVAIKSSEADRFMERNLGSFSAFLVHGADVGLVSERTSRIVRSLVDDPSDPFQLVRLNGDDLARDPGRLADEARTVPLFGGRRAVLVEIGSKSIVPAVELALTTPNTCPIVFEAGALKADSALLVSFERAKHAAAIESAPDDERDVARLIDQELGKAGMAIEPDAKAFLVSLLGADRLASRSEIAKLILYARGQSTIGLGDVEQAVADASALAAEAALDAAFLGDFPALDLALERLGFGSAAPDTLLMAALRHAIALHRVKLGARGGYFRAGMTQRRKMTFDRQVSLFPAESLARIVARLGEAIGEARRDPRLAESHVTRALWTIAHSARPRGR